MTKQENKQEIIKRPSLILYFTETFRAIGDRVASIQFRKTFTPTTKGDGHPVLVIPGFLTSDTSTKILRDFIKRIGHTPYAWEMGRNYGNIEDLVTLVEKLDALHKKHQEKVSLIGWSLGGVYARELAKQRPELVRQVITLGSPFAGLQEPNNASWIFDLMKGEKAKKLDPVWLATVPNPAPVPTTALYSKKDGIVSWMVCMEKEDALHQNIEVRGSHLGFGFNKQVMVIIADRLSYSEANWKLYGGNSKTQNSNSKQQVLSDKMLS